MAGYPPPLRRGAYALLLLLVLSCAPRRPSDVPLGRGPLAGVEEPVATTKKAPASTPTEPSGGVEETTVASSEPDEQSSEAADSDDEDESGSTEDSENPAAGLNGEYAGTDTTIFRMDGAPERSQEDPKARTRVRAAKGRTIEFTLIDSSDGHDICTLTGRLTDRTATIDTGQECFSQGNEAASTRGVVRSGKATLEDDELELDLELDFEVVAAGSVNEGKLIYHFEGKRE